MNLAARLASIRADAAFKAAEWHYRNPSGNKIDVDALLWLAAFRFGFQTRRAAA